jgi:UDP-glucose 4-epimerase
MPKHLATARRDPVRSSAAVIGAAGFIGRPLCTALDAQGVRVARFTRARPFMRDGRLAPELLAAHTIFFVATSIDPARAETQVGLADADHRTFVALLDGLRSVGHHPTLIYTSSGGTVYDATAEPPYSEDAPLGPLAAYGRCKLRLERELLARTDAVRPVILRLANIYGPGQPETGGVVARWLALAARREPVVIFGSPRAARDYLYIDDAVEALMRVHNHSGVEGEVFNIGSGVPVMLARLVDLVSAAAGRPLAVNHKDGRPFDRLAYWLDISAADQILGWRPRTPLELGVRRTWNAMHAGHLRAAV